MKSFDINLLLYAANRDAKEHKKAVSFIQEAMQNSQAWVIADQVYFEIYRLLRNPVVLGNPLTAREAASVIRFYRMESGFLHCSFESEFMEDVLRMMEKPDFPAARTFDLVLAVTLKRNGVTEFFTKNRKDFLDFNWFQVLDPL